MCVGGCIGKLGRASEKRRWRYVCHSDTPDPVLVLNKGIGAGDTRRKGWHSAGFSSSQTRVKGDYEA